MTSAHEFGSPRVHFLQYTGQEYILVRSVASLKNRTQNGLASQDARLNEYEKHAHDEPKNQTNESIARDVELHCISAVYP